MRSLKSAFQYIIQKLRRHEAADVDQATVLGQVTIRYRRRPSHHECADNPAHAISPNDNICIGIVPVCKY